MKILANMWKNLPPLEKLEYERIAEDDKTRYYISFKKFIISLSSLLSPPFYYKNTNNRYFDELSKYHGPMHVPNKRQKKPAVSL
jgi:hypothetical protein